MVFLSCKNNEMDLSNIRLVVTDMDGTLLNNNGDVSTRFLNQFSELKKRNVHFVAASGRQYQSILEKLPSIKKEITIIAENGGLIQHNNKIEVLFKLSGSDVLKAVNKLRNIEACFIVLCGRKSAYIETKNQDFMLELGKYYSVFSVVEDLTEVIDDDFLKIAVYHFESSEIHVFPYIDELKDDLRVVTSGQNWLDISHPEVDKSYPVKMLQKELNVTEKETMIFGDYNNDLQMLKLGYFSYAMQNAHPNVKKIARFETKSNSDEGVESVLEELLKTPSSTSLNV